MDVTPSDWLHIISSAAVGVAIIATVKTDIRWIKQWCRDHKKSDEEDFKDLRAQVAELRRIRSHSPRN